MKDRDGENYSYLGQGYPSSLLPQTGYATGGMSLAVTQRDLLVSISNNEQV